jgi:hypothetical protein
MDMSCEPYATLRRLYTLLHVIDDDVGFRLEDPATPLIAECKQSLCDGLRGQQAQVRLPDRDIMYLLLQAFLVRPAHSMVSVLDYILRHADKPSGSDKLSMEMADRVVYHILLDQDVRNSLLAGDARSHGVRAVMASHIEFCRVNLARYAYRYIRPCIDGGQQQHHDEPLMMGNHTPWWKDAVTLVGLFTAGVPIVDVRITAKPFLSPSNLAADEHTEVYELMQQLVDAVDVVTSPSTTACSKLGANAPLKVYMYQHHKAQLPRDWLADIVLLRRVIFRAFRRHVERKYRPEGAVMRRMILSWMADER